MSDSDQFLANIAYRSSDEILAHSRFAAARTAFVDAVLRHYEGDLFLTRLLVEAGRTVIFTVILCLHAHYDEADRATWPTMRLLKEKMVQFGLSSARRIEDLVARLAHTRFLESLASESDRRVRLLTPTAKMISEDQSWLAAHYRPLHVMFPDPGYAQAIERDLSFQRAHRRAAMGFFALGAQVMASNPAMMLFLSRDAGVMILIKLIQMSGAGGDKASEGLSYADIGARFGVSRTHVRAVLQDAEQAGLVSLASRGGRFVQLKPSILQAFDRFVADSMSGNDLLFQISLTQMKGHDRAPK
jgi:hypothetical protein